jgi:cell division protein FtsA
MCGVRLEGHVHIVTGHTSSIQNLVKCVEQVGLNVDQILLQPIASSRSVLSSEEKEMGVVLIDIGGGTTDLAIWKDGGLIHSQIIPVGGNHFTNDLAVALKVPHNEAERIKINHGSVLPEVIESPSQIVIEGLSHARKRQESLQLVASVLGARAEELFNVIKKVVKEKDLEYELNGGFVLTGGGALIRNIVDLAEFILEKPAKIGIPQSVGRMTNVMKDPKFSTVLGLMQESIGQIESGVIVEESNEFDIISKLGSSLKNVFKEIF